MILRTVFLGIVAASAIATPALAEQGMFSYDPSDDETRALADNGFTLVFEKGLMGGVRLKRLMSTEAPASAELIPADERDLGVSLRELNGRSEANDLYLISETEQGPAMVRAFCPGSTKAWLAFGPVKARRPLEIGVFGDDPATSKARRCATLRFAFRGEWKMLGPGAHPRQADFSRP